MKNKFKKIGIIFDIEIDFESQKFAIFDNFYSTDRKTSKLFKGLVVNFKPKEGLVKCATVCVKSEVILEYNLVIIFKK